MNTKQISLFLLIFVISGLNNAIIGMEHPDNKMPEASKPTKTRNWPIIRKTKVFIDDIKRVWTADAEGETYRGYLREGEPVVIMQDIQYTKNKSGKITVYSEKDFLSHNKNKFLQENGSRLKFGDDEIHAYFTRCNGFSVIEEHTNEYLHGDENQLFNPCKNIRVKGAVKDFLKKKRATAKKQQK